MCNLYSTGDMSILFDEKRHTYHNIRSGKCLENIRKLYYVAFGENIVENDVKSLRPTK